MVEKKGREKRELRRVLKIRPVDLKVGKYGLSPEFMRECAKVLAKESMIKLALPADKDLQLDLINEFSQKTSAQFIAKVGKTVAFYQSNE